MLLDVPKFLQVSNDFPTCLIKSNLRFTIFIITYEVGYTPRPNGAGSEKLAKSSLGAEYTVPSKHFPNIKEAVSYLRESGYSLIVGMETYEDSVSYTDVSYCRKGRGTAVILGNEVTGISTDTIPYLDKMVEILFCGSQISGRLPAAGSFPDI